jgi:O-glycosyl hydrolase
MKSYLLLLLSLVLLSCNNTIESQYSNKIEEFVKPTMNDPESFELVKIIKIDTFTYSLEKQKQFYRKWLDATTNRELHESLKSEYVRDRKSQDYSYVHVLAQIRGKNAFGGIITNELSFYFDNDNKLTGSDDNNYNLLEDQFRNDFGLDPYHLKNGTSKSKFEWEK